MLFMVLPQYMLKRLQRVQTCAAGYVFRRYATVNDIFTLKWLPIVEFIEFITVKLVHQAIYAENWPAYLKLETVQYNRNTRLSQDGIRIKYGESRTFQEQAKAFNFLPKSIREESCFGKFVSETRQFYKDKAKARLSL